MGGGGGRPVAREGSCPSKQTGLTWKLLFCLKNGSSLMMDVSTGQSCSLCRVIYKCINIQTDRQTYRQTNTHANKLTILSGPTWKKKSLFCLKNGRSLMMEVSRGQSSSSCRAMYNMFKQTDRYTNKQINKQTNKQANYPCWTNLEVKVALLPEERGLLNIAVSTGQSWSSCRVMSKQIYNHAH